MVNKDVATLSQWLQCFMVCIHKHCVCILYKHGPELYIGDWLTWNSDEKTGTRKLQAWMLMCMPSLYVVSPICTSIKDIQAATSQDSDLYWLKAYIIRGWQHIKDKVEHSIQSYWSIRHELLMNDDIAMKGKQLYFIPVETNTWTTVQQPHWHWKNKTPREKVVILVQHECRHRKYCLSIASHAWSTSRCKQMKVLPHNILCTPSQMVSADMF